MYGLKKHNKQKSDKYEEFYPGYIYNGQLFYNLCRKMVHGNIYTLVPGLFKMLM